MRRWQEILEDFIPHREIDYLYLIKPAELAEQDIRLVIIDLDHTLTGLNSNAVPGLNLFWLAQLKTAKIAWRVTTLHPYRAYTRDIEEQIGQCLIRPKNIFKFNASLIKQAWEKVNCLPHQTLVINDSRILLSSAKRMGCITCRVTPIYHREKGFDSLFLRFLRWIEHKFLLPQLIKMTRLEL